MKERVHKLLAEANIGSRRAAEEMIEQGRVRVNGAVIKLGDKADKATDVIEVDGSRVNFDTTPKRYIALYKPMQTLSTTQPHSDDERDTIFDFVPFKDERLFSIGRLDADSEGLIVLTNDGDLAERLSHPRFRHTKTYRVTVIGLPTADTIERWQHGIELEDGLTAPCSVKISKGNPRETVLRITMTEGKKRQIRRVALALGHPVRRLIRTHIGMLSGETMSPGEWRELDRNEVEALQTPMPDIKTLRGMLAGDMNSGRSAPFRPRQYQSKSDERPRRPAGDRPRTVRPAGDRPPRREGGYRPRQDSGEARPDGDAPTWRKGADDVIQSWGAGNDTPGERARREAREARGDRPRREGESSGDSRPPRREGSSDRPYRPRTDGDSRPPRREGSSDRPYRPRTDGDSRPPPRREGSSDRPYRPRTDGDSRPPRRDGDSRPPPRREGSSDRPYRPRT
ncbi:MAG: pseudouridine synthase, partial [Chloroflexota bacterium]|nr:pseudouridine synthase [Chloroflexota bacterium]